jgi:hypothetical protein
LEREATIPWVLQRATPVNIRVLSKEDGRPIPGARLLVCNHKAQKNRNIADNAARGFNSSGLSGWLQLAVSDDEGNAVITQLRDDSVYGIVVRSDTHQASYLARVLSEEGDREILLGQMLYVSGTVVGDLTQLNRLRFKDDPDPQPRIFCMNRHLTAGHPSSDGRGAAVVMRDGKATFKFTNLWAGKLTIRAGQYSSEHELLAPITNVVVQLDPNPVVVAPRARVRWPPVVDLRELPRRDVEIRLVAPEGQPDPQGRLKVVTWKARKGDQRLKRTRWLDIEDGRVRLSVPVGWFYQCETTGLAGYWIPKVRTDRLVVLPPSDEPLIVEIPCFPAGAIYGDIVEPDGDPAHDVFLRVQPVKRIFDRSLPYSYDRFSTSLGVRVKVTTRVDDGSKRFMAGPLPVGGHYVIVAQRGSSITTSPEMEISPDKPVQEIRMTMPEGVDVVGAVLDEQGQPLAGVKMLVERKVRAKHPPEVVPSEHFSCVTDEAGNFKIKDVNPDKRASHEIHIYEYAGYRSKHVQFTPGAKRVTITLQKGRQLRGRLVDDKTGWPIPGARVYVQPHPYSQIRSGWNRSGPVTDENGRYIVAYLDDGEYRLGLSGPKLNSGERIVRGGMEEEVVLRVTLPEGSPLEPRKPE